MKDLPLWARVVVRTSIISRHCLADYVKKLNQKACHTCSTIVDTVHSHGCRHSTLEYMPLCVYGTKCLPDGHSIKINSFKVLIFHPVEGVRLTVVFNSCEAKTRQSLRFVSVIAWFVVIFGINSTSDISKLFYMISRAVRLYYELHVTVREWWGGAGKIRPVSDMIG